MSKWRPETRRPWSVFVGESTLVRRLGTIIQCSRIAEMEVFEWREPGLLEMAGRFKDLLRSYKTWKYIFSHNAFSIFMTWKNSAPCFLICVLGMHFRLPIFVSIVFSPGPMLFIYGRFYDGGKPIVEPLSNPVFMLHDHANTRPVKVALVGISSLRPWVPHEIRSLPFILCRSQASVRTIQNQVYSFYSSHFNRKVKLAYSFLSPRWAMWISNSFLQLSTRLPIAIPKY